jgi:hypothetical protein
VTDSIGVREASGLRAVDRRFRPPGNAARQESSLVCGLHHFTFMRQLQLAIPTKRAMTFR